MDEKELKTSPKQRFFIILIALIMVGSIIASYAAIVISGSQGAQQDETSQIDEAKIAEYEADYAKVEDKIKDASKSYYDKFIKYKSEVKAYNEAAANENGVQSKDLKEGSGDKVSDDNYLAFYVGWCADESVFDSTYDDNDNPTGFAKILDPTVGLIEGWTEGVKGMKIGGIREVTIPGEKAYAETREVCGGTNKPLKFMILAVEKKDELENLAAELAEIGMKLQYAQYGIDYDAMMQTEE